MKYTKTKAIFDLLKQRSALGLAQVDLHKLLREGKITDDTFVNDISRAISVLRSVHHVEIGQMQEINNGQKYQRYFYVSGEYRDARATLPGPMTRKPGAQAKKASTKGHPWTSGFTKPTKPAEPKPLQYGNCRSCAAKKGK